MPGCIERGCSVEKEFEIGMGVEEETGRGWENGGGGETLTCIFYLASCSLFGVWVIFWPW